VSKVDDGGCVTPDMLSHRPQPDGTTIEDRITMVGGVKLRDYFAAAALQGILAYPGDFKGSAHSNSDQATVAKYAYGFADAMIAARKEGQP